MIVRPFRAEDLALLAVQPMQELELALLSQQARRMLEQKSEPAVTAMEGDEVIGCAGIVPVVEPRAIWWVFLSRAAGPHMLALARLGKRLLVSSRFDRVETTVRADFPEGHRLARLVGLKDETPGGMQKYGPNGAEHLYARVR